MLPEDDLCFGPQRCDEDWFAALAGIGVAAFTIRDSGTVSRSPLLDRILGYADPPGFWSWDRILEHIVPEHRLIVRRAFEETPQDWRSEVRIIGADGIGRWVSLTLTRRGNEAIGLVADSTERKSADRTASQQHREYEALIRASPLPILTFDISGNITHWNPAAERVFGWTLGEVLGKPIPFIPRHKLEEHQLMRQLDFSGSGFDEREIERVRRDGSPIKLSVSTAPVRNEQDEVTGVISIYADITAQKRVEAALRETADRLSLAISVSGLGDWRWDAATGDVYLSSAAAAIFRLEPNAEITLAGLLKRIHPEDRQTVTGSIERSAAESADNSFAVRLDVPGASGTWVSGSVRALYDANGALSGVIGIVQDITKARLADHERKLLFEREQEARAAAELLNRAGRLLAAELDPKRLAQQITDVATEIIGAALGAFFHTPEHEDEEPFRIYAISGLPQNTRDGLPELERSGLFTSTLSDRKTVRSADVTADERFPRDAPFSGIPGIQPEIRSYLAAPVLSRTGDVLGGLFFGHPKPGVFTERHERMILGIAAQAATALDNARLYAQAVGERAKAEEATQALQRSNAELRRANEDLNQFAYSASHDLQEPLRMVAAYSQLLAREYDSMLDPESRQYLNFLVQGATRMEALLYDLLAYTRAVDVGLEPAEAEAGEVFRRATENLQAAIQEQAAIIDANPLPAVRMLDTHLLQVFQNLLSNGLKYRSERRPEIEVRAEAGENEWIFSVTDNGIGIPPRYTSHIFGIFKRLHNHALYPGTGIGLAICQRIVERYGGRIWVESIPGTGSTFRFTIPFEPPLA